MEDTVSNILFFWAVAALACWAIFRIALSSSAADPSDEPEECFDDRNGTI